MKVLPLRLLWHRDRPESGGADRPGGAVAQQPAEGAAPGDQVDAPGAAPETEMPPVVSTGDRGAAGDAGTEDADRRRIIERFEAWLEGVLAGEPAPRGLAAEILEAFSSGCGGAGAGEASKALVREAGSAGQTDLLESHGRALPDRAALWSALTTLSQEVALQGRAFKQLDATLAPLGAADERLRAVEESQDDVAQRLEALGDDVQALRDSARREGQEEALNVLLDLYARLHRGFAACRTMLAGMAPRRPAMWRRLLGLGAAESRSSLPHRAAEALAEGYGLTLGRLQDALRAMEITPIDQAGAPFDPHTMAAVTATRRDGVAPGIVLEVYEPGFMRRGEPIRTARVGVSASGSGDAPPSQDEQLEDSR